MIKVEDQFINAMANKFEVIHGGEENDTKPSASEAALMARELISSAMTNINSVEDVRYLQRLQTMLKDIDFEKLEKQMKRTEEARRKDHSRGGFHGEDIIK